MNKVLPFLLLGLAGVNAYSMEINVVGEAWEGYTQADGKGAYIELVKEIFEPEGVAVNWKTYPWARAAVNVETNAADAIIGDYFYSDESQNTALYPNWHISVEEPIVVLLRDEATLDTWQKNIGKDGVVWIRGYGFENADWWNTDTLFTEVATVEQGLKMLDTRRVSAYIGYESQINAALVELDLQDLFEPVTLVSDKKLYLIFSNTEKSKELIQVFDRRMSQLVSSGRVEEIYNAWGLNLQKLSPERFGEK